MYKLKKMFAYSLFISFSMISVLLGQVKDESFKLYEDSSIARIDVDIAPQYLYYILNNTSSDSEHVAKFRFRNSFIDETIDSIGFRLRGNTSRNAKKKSFKVSFNTFIKGRKFYDVEKLNLNGEHNDPSIIRSKLCFDMFNKSGIIASRASHAELYINGEYYGLYISVEHIDEEFIQKNFAEADGNLWKCLYPANLQYEGSDPNVYKNLNNNGTPVYELKTNEDEGDFSKLVNLITYINQPNMTTFAKNLESVIDISSVLKYFAWNILFGSWDSYRTLSNNYYLYHRPNIDKFTFIPYDYDNSYGIEWGSNNWSSVNPYSPPIISGGNTPLGSKMMQVNEYKDLYTHFLEFYSDKLFKLALWENRIDSLKSKITASVIADTFRTLDYGFTIDDFNNSFSASGYSNAHVRFGLKQFINLRNNTLLNQLNYVGSLPIAYEINYYPQNPSGQDSIYFYVSGFCNSGIQNAKLKVKVDNTATELDFPLVYSPVENTVKVEENDRYIGVIPPQGSGKRLDVAISLTNGNSQTQSFPRESTIVINTQTDLPKTVVINEFLADNENSSTDPNGEHDDWVELFNTSNEQIVLSGKYLTDNPTNLVKWKFPVTPQITIEPNAFLIVWLDDQTTQTGIHASFKISKSGEYLALIESDGITIMDSLTFGQQQTDISFGRYTDGTNNWVFMQPTLGTNNLFTDVEEFVSPISFAMNVYPNPFNPSTKIAFSIPKGENTSIKIYDILGREVLTLLDEYKSAGSYLVEFNTSKLNKILSSGMYLCRIESGEYIKTEKIVLLK